MKRIIRYLTVIVLMFFCCGICFAEAQLRGYKPVSLAQGTFLKAISQREISTSTVHAGDLEYFISPVDVFMGESNIIPKNSVYVARIESVVEAVEGINAAMKIRVFKVVTPNEKQYTLDAYLYWNNTTTVGGDLAEVQYYTTMPHYPGTWKKGVLQFVPTSVRYFGKPTVIKAGEEVTFVINKDMKLFPYKDK